MWRQLKANSVFCSLVLVLFVLASGIGTAGYWYYSVQTERVREQIEDQVSAIAELKVNEIARWRAERLADAHIVMDTPLIARLVRRSLESPEDPLPIRRILGWIRSYKNHYDYYSVALIGVEGNTLLSLPEGVRAGDELLQAISDALRTKEPVLADLERSESAPDIHMDLVVPLSDSEQDNVSPVGVLLLRINPYKFLYPSIQSWPTPSYSAEMLLVRREGEEVVFLNELRYRKNTALSMRLPMKDLESPEVMAGRGHEGVVAGLDFRGSPVVAAIDRVPDTSWFLIAKIDADEVYAPVRERALLIGFLITLMIAGAGVTLGLVWSYQRSRLYLEQYKTEAEKLGLAQRYEHLTRNANDIILLAREDGTLTEANQRALTAYGYAPDELLGMNLRTLEASETVPDVDARMRLALDQDGFVYETTHCRKDGTSFPVEISTRVVKLVEGNFYLEIIRDITERKQAEKALEEARDTLETRVRERTADLLVMNERLTREIEMRTRAEDELRAVTVRLAETEEGERRRLARELHDRVGQNLTALNFNISAVKNLLPDGSGAEAKDRLEDSLNLVGETVKCVRNVMADLRPPLLDDYGLAAVLRWYCREFWDRTGIPTVVRCEGAVPRLHHSVEITLFRIAQEALTNVMRHAQASQAAIELRAGDKTVCMTITDNGVGFDPKATASPPSQESGWGVLSMRERAEMVGGHLRVDSVPGRGTRITIEVTR
jgi:PAS domain S-box-containing protein